MNARSRLVSIVVPVFNGARFLPIALESISSQDHWNLEIIGVDDGSTDESREVLESFSKGWSGPMKVLTHQGGGRMGIAASYRLGSSTVRGSMSPFWNRMTPGRQTRSRLK